jgi:hypothetical protein
MQDLKKMKLIDLLDLLLEHTEYHTDLIANGASFHQVTISEQDLIEIQQEIEARKRSTLPEQGPVE